MPYFSSKTYTHSQGLSCCFRQWRAESHCRFLHGYALQVRIIFGGHGLDENGWIQDFGSLKPVKQWLEDMFDHNTCVAGDDPYLDEFRVLSEQKIIQLMVFPNGVGMEKFAKLIFEYADSFVLEQSKGRVFVNSVEVREHEANSAAYSRPTTRNEAINDSNAYR